MSEENKEKNTNTASGIQVTMILLGILITPVLLSSSKLGSQLELITAAKVIAIGSIILAILAMTNLYIGQKARIPTYGVVKYSFGKKGAVIINIVMAISLFGWLTVTANMFGNTLQTLLATYLDIHIPLAILVGLGCIIFVSVTAFGFETLGKLSRVTTPIVIILMFIILYLALKKTGTTISTKNNPMSFSAAVSSVVGTIIVLVATTPDFGSFTKNGKNAILAGLLTFGVAYPILFFVGAVPSSMTGQDSLISAMTMIGYALPAIIVLVIACITGNSGNMFQETLVVSTLLPQFKKWKITIVLGILATILGSFNISAWFIPFLLLLGIATPPISGIYIADFFLYRRNGFDESILDRESAVKPIALVAWIIGSIIGYCTVKDYFVLTGVSSIDSTLIASIIYFLLSYTSKRK